MIVTIYRWRGRFLERAPEHWGETMGGWRRWTRGGLADGESFALTDPTGLRTVGPIDVMEWPGE